MRLLTEQEIADRIRDAFGQYPVSDVALEAICHNLQNAYEGYIIVDDRNRLLFLSEANERFFSVAGSRPFLRPNSEINPTSRLDQVIRTGKSEVGDVAEFPGGHIRIVSRFPIVRDGKVIGAYGKVIFANVGRLNQVMREIDELRSRLKVAEEELSTLKSTRFSFEQILGSSHGIRTAKEMAQRVCRSNASVLLIGETGTGKEMFAYAMHYNSPRASGPFVRLNCAAVSDELAEAEFFGYKPGAFTGASPRGKPGIFRQAHGGTLFLDEIQELSARIQSKILRVIQEKEFTQVGGVETEKTDFRLITATNRNSPTLSGKGNFGETYIFGSTASRSDSLLADRSDDILLFIRYFSKTIAAQNGQPEKTITPSALDILLSYSWPGNVREVANVLEQAFWNSQSNKITQEDIPRHLDPGGRSGRLHSLDQCERLAVFLSRVEKETIIAALEEEGGNRSRVAKRLGIHRTLLYKKMNKYGINGNSRNS